MSCQCAKCLKFCRDDISENGVDIFRCDECKWEAPFPMVNWGLAVYPKQEYEEWANLQYRKSRAYYKDGE